MLSTCIKATVHSIRKLAKNLDCFFIRLIANLLLNMHVKHSEHVRKYYGKQIRTMYKRTVCELAIQMHARSNFNLTLHMGTTLPCSNLVYYSTFT